MRSAYLLSEVQNNGTFDLSIGSTETNYKKLNTKTQNIFCCVNENLTTFYTLWLGGQENRRRKKVFFLKWIQKSNVILKIWVLVFSFMILVSDPMDRSVLSDLIVKNQYIF